MMTTIPIIHCLYDVSGIKWSGLVMINCSISYRIKLSFISSLGNLDKTQSPGALRERFQKKIFLVLAFDTNMSLDSRDFEYH